jgi:hypothetical protein
MSFLSTAVLLLQGDLSFELDKRIKQKVAEFCGKEEYEAGDLSREIGKRVKARVAEFTGKPEYSLGKLNTDPHNLHTGTLARIPFTNISFC